METYLSDPTFLFAFLASVLALIFWASTLPKVKKLFTYVPPVIWAYFVPMFLTTAGITPSQNPLYGWMSTVLLPFSLFLLMITLDLPAVLRLGWIALIMMLTGTVGVILGGPVAFFLFEGFLPPDAWKGFAALSGSWIGGTANMVAIQQSVGAPDSVLGPIIVVDTVVGYGWMGILISLAAFQKRFDRWVKADVSIIEHINHKLSLMDTTRRPISTADLAIMIGFALAATSLSIVIGRMLPEIGDPTIIGTSTWSILIVVTLGLLLSFTPARNIERAGASKMGYWALYLLLTSIGARADLAAVLEVPVYLLAGVVWILIHIGILFVVARLLKAPLFLVAAGSMANIGGAASAPVVAGVYHPAMAPVGLLMAVAGYGIGVYGGLLCARILAMIAAG